MKSPKTPKTLDQAQQIIQKAGEAARTQIVSIREKIEDKKAERYDLENGYVTAPEFMANVGQWIDTRADEFGGEQRLGTFLRANGGRGRSCELMEINVRPAPFGAGSADVTQLLCFLFAPVLKQRMAELAGSFDLPDGPPLADRPALIQKLDEQIFALECREEALIVSAENAGIHAPRHPDARPEIVLEWID